MKNEKGDETTSGRRHRNRKDDKKLGDDVTRDASDTTRKQTQWSTTVSMARATTSPFDLHCFTDARSTFQTQWYFRKQFLNA